MCAACDVSTDAQLGLDSRPVHVTTLGKLLTHMCASVTKQYNLVPCQGAVMPCGWKGNRWSGVALSMRPRLQWFIHLRAHDLRKEDEHLAYTAHEVWHTLPFLHCTDRSKKASLSVCAKSHRSVVCSAVLIEHRLVTDRDTGPRHSVACV